MIGWRMRGYSNMEACSRLGMKKSTYYKKWNRIKGGIKNKRSSYYIDNITT